MTPFRFGVQLSNASSGAAWRDLARTIEALGYSSLFIPDHFEDQFGPLVALTVAAEATTDLKVGSLVFGNDYRHPVVLAKEIATLDLVSEGRVEFGLGAGWMTTDYEQSGIVNDPPGVRISRMAESLTVMKSLWSTGAATLAGEHYTITGAVGAPLPHSRPHPPIIIGGGGRRVLGSPRGRRTSSGSTRAWPPATSARRCSRPPRPSTTTSGSPGSAKPPGTGSTVSSCSA